MKMQVWKILNFSTVDDEPVGLEVEFLHKVLHRGIQVRKKGGVLWVEVRQCLNLLFRNYQNMDLVTGCRVMEGEQSCSLAQALNRNGKTHVGEDPADEENDEANVEKLFHDINVER